MPNVFLSYNSRDSPAVLAIAEPLKQALEPEGFGVWLDEWELRPGLPFQVDLGAALQNSAAIAVFVGAAGLGRWEGSEIEVALDRQVSSQAPFPVIPVLLPGTPPGLSLPPFLRRNVMVTFAAPNDNRALSRLVWGITGRRQQAAAALNVEQAPANNVAHAAQSEEVELLGENLRSGNVTFFVGSTLPHEGTDVPPSSGELACDLLRAIPLIEAGYRSLLPPLDVAGTYFALGKGETLLTRRVRDLILARSIRPPETHRALADLLALLSRRRWGRLKAEPQLVVTTGLDVTMERSLLLAGVSFSRIVQHRSMSRLDINQYRIMPSSDAGQLAALDAGSTRQVARGDVRALDDLILTCERRTLDRQADAYSLAFDDLVSPILYKFRGSIDVPESVAMTADQYFQFTRQVAAQAVPKMVTAIIGNTPSVFLGCSYLDPDFRVLYHALLREAFVKDDPRYAVDLRPQLVDADPSRKVEMELWEKVKAQRQSRGIATVEESPQKFLGALKEWSNANLEFVS